MADFLQKCEEYFGSKDFYEILKLEKTASEQQLKKAYHRLSLHVHPDRVPEPQKLLATEKFKVLGKIHSILQDKDKRKIYDESGDFDDEDDSTSNWMNYWRSMFKPITKEDIEEYEKNYIGSVTELNDIKKAYVNGKGSMDHILECVMFSSCDTEDRILGIVRKMVDNGEVEEYDGFFNETAKSKAKRKRKWDKERKEAEKINVDDLTVMLKKSAEDRMKNFGNLINRLETKYGNKKTPRTKQLTSSSPPTKKRKITPTSPKRQTRSSKK